MDKFKLYSRRQVFKKFGKDIKVRDKQSKEVKLNLQSNLKRINKWNINAVLPYEIFYYNLRTKSSLGQSCAACGSTENVEMHHRKPLRSGKTDNTFKGIAKNIARHQIPLCRLCHVKVHSGIYDGPGIK